MFRRSLKIFCIVALILLLGTSVIAQFSWFGLEEPHGQIGAFPSGVMFNNLHIGKWDAWYQREPFHVLSFLEPPRWYVGGGVYELILPWWLLLATWGLLTALVWRLTRCREVSHAFPVEPIPTPT